MRLLGLPNCRPSPSFLASVTAAKPKIADYPFTTFDPNLGCVRPGWRGNVAWLIFLADLRGAMRALELGCGILGHVRALPSLVEPGGWLPVKM